MTSRDNSFWHAYLEKVVPSKRSKAPKLKGVFSENLALARSNHPKIVALQTFKSSASARQPTALDDTPLERRREKSLKHGDLVIDARIDLHGMTQGQAWDELRLIVSRCVRSQLRTLLVITGRGVNGEGALRRNLKAWVSEFHEASAVLAIRPAAPRHGGDGAFYILFRNFKKPTRF